MVMTKKELGGLYYLEKEIEEQQLRLRALKERSTYASGQSNGMPSGSGDRDRLGKICAEIIDLEKMISDNNYLRIRKIKQITWYVSNIEDSRTRCIIAMRFIDGYSWTKIAFKLGGGNTADGVRKIVERHFKKGEQNGK